MTSQATLPTRRGKENRRSGRHARDEPVARAVSLRQVGSKTASTQDAIATRNALVALGNSGGDEHRAQLARYADGDDELLADHARWALGRIEARA